MEFFIERVIAFFTSLVLVICSFTGISVNNITKKTEKFRVTTYLVGTYIYNEESLHPEDFNIVTDAILFGCARFDNAGKVTYDRDTLETALSNLRKTIGNRDVSISLNILGPSGHTDSDVWEEQMEAQSEEHNKAFTSGVLEDNIIALLDKYSFDGVHFDYEYPLSDKAWRYYNNFLISIDKKLNNYTLGVAASDWNLKFTTEAVKAVDTFELMLYDMSDENGRHSTYESMKKTAFNSGFNGIPFEKTNIGLPFYARPDDMSAYWYDYKGYCDKIDENGWYHCDNTGKDFWFNTPEVIEQKTDFAINNGYGGVMIWHYTCDLPSGHNQSLLGAIGRSVSDNY